MSYKNKLMKQTQANALDFLRELTKKRLWHKNKISQRLASKHKQNLKNNRLTYEKACEILTQIGYTKVAEEICECSQR